MITSLERRLETVNLVGLNGKMHVNELAAYFNVTGATIRADLRFLDDNGFIARAHGFALVKREVLSELLNSQKKEKQDDYSFSEFVADAIYSELEEVNTIFLDCSPIIRNAVSQLDNLKHATVVTRDLNLVQYLPQINDANFFVTGGKVDTKQMKMTGSHVLSSLRNYRFKKALIHVDSVTSSGVFSDNEFDAELIKLLCELSEQVIIVNDSTMFNSNCAFWSCECSEISTVITDSNVSKNTVESLRAYGIKILNPD